MVRSIEPGEAGGQHVETTLEALRESDSARTWLTRFIGMYEGMDTGPGDPVHAVRMKAQEFLDAGPTDEHPPTIVKMIGQALPTIHELPRWNSRGQRPLWRRRSLRTLSGVESASGTISATCGKLLDDAAIDLETGLTGFTVTSTTTSAARTRPRS